MTQQAEPEQKDTKIDIGQLLKQNGVKEEKDEESVSYRGETSGSAVDVKDEQGVAADPMQLILNHRSSVEPKYYEDQIEKVIKQLEDPQTGVPLLIEQDFNNNKNSEERILLFRILTKALIICKK